MLVRRVVWVRRSADRRVDEVVGLISGSKTFLGGPLYRGAVSPPRNPAHPCTPLHRLSLKIRDIKTVELDSLKVPLRNLRRRSQEFLSGSKKSSKPAEKSTKATQSA